MVSDYEDPAKLTEEMGEDISEEPIDEIETEIGETESIAETETEVLPEAAIVETAKAGGRSRSPRKPRKVTRKSQGTESPSLTELHGELRKHSDARQKTDLAIKDIEKQLKDLLLTHHTAIRDLKKQVAQLRSRLAAAESRKTVAKAKTKKKDKKKHSKKNGKKKNKKR